MNRTIFLCLLALMIALALSCSLVPLSSNASGVRYALICGLAYSGGSTLSYTIADAQSMETSLTSLGYHTSRITADGGNITAEVILKAVSNLEEQVTGDDLVVFFFAGHSGFLSDGVFSLEAEGKTYISAEEILYAFSLFPCPVVIILDSCESGGLIPEDPFTVDTLYYRDQTKEFRDELPGNAVSQAWDAYFHAPKSFGIYDHIWVLSAAGYHQQAYEPPSGANSDLYGNTVKNGYFTHFLLMGLDHLGESLHSDGARYGVITLAELYGFVLSQFRKHWSHMRHVWGIHPYLPHVSGSPRDVILAAKL